MRQLCRLTWRWIPCRSLGRWCGSLCFFWAPLRHERCVGTCWDMKWFETLSKHVQTIALAVLESWTSGPSYVLQNVIKAYQSISRNIIYIYIVLTYIHNYICGYFQLIPKYVHGIQELETRYDSRRRVSACFAGCPRYEAWWGLLQKRQTQ